MIDYYNIIMIPARLGSQRLKQKNLETIHSKPILQIAAEKAKLIRGINEVWINSESNELGKIAEKVGAGYHKRPESLANNVATSEDFISEFLSKHTCDYLIQLHSIAPLLSVEEIQGFVNYLIEAQPDVLLSYEPVQIECVYKNNPVNFSLSQKTNSQELEPVKRISWSISAWKSESFLKARSVGDCATYYGKIDYFPISKMAAHVIKTKEDLEIARALFNVYNHQ